METGVEHTQEARDLIKDLLCEGLFTRSEIKQMTGIDFSTMTRWAGEAGWKVRVARDRKDGTPEAAEVVRRANVVVKYVADMKRAGRWKDGREGQVPRTIAGLRVKKTAPANRCRFQGVDLDRYRSLLSLMKKGFRLFMSGNAYALRKGGAETAVSVRMAKELMGSRLVHKVQRHGKPQYMIRRRIDSPFERMQRGVDHAVRVLSGGGGDGQAGASFKTGNAPLPSIADDKEPASRGSRERKQSQARQS